MGVLYDGRKITKARWAKSNSAVYCIRPKLLKECGLAEQFKLGFTGGQTTRSSLQVRMGTYSTSFIEFEIIFAITYSRKDPETQHNISSMAEAEVFAFLEKEGASRRVHVSGTRQSEWFINLDINTVKRCFDHMLDLGTPALRKGSSHFIPQPESAWWFGEDEIIMGEDGSVPMSAEAILPLSNENDRVRRNLVRQLKDAKQQKNQKKIDNIQAQLDTLLEGVRIEIEDFPSQTKTSQKETPKETTKDTEDDAQTLAAVDLSDSEPMAMTDTEDDFEIQIEDDVEAENVVTLFGGGGTTRQPKQRATKQPVTRRQYNLRSQGMQLRSRRLPAIEETVAMFM